MAPREQRDVNRRQVCSCPHRRTFPEQLGLDIVSVSLGFKLCR